MAGRPLRLLLITPNYANNSLGRTYCLWLLARELGWNAQIAGVNGEALWEPLRLHRDAGGFAADCHILTSLPAAAQSARLDEMATDSDVIIAVKPLPTSLGVA